MGPDHGTSLEWSGKLRELHVKPSELLPLRQHELRVVSDPA